MVNNLPANAGDARDVGSNPGVPGDPPEKEMEPTPVFLSGKFLAGYSPWGC